MTSENYDIFVLVLEVDALQNFILGYRMREIQRFQENQSGLHLSTELDPAINYIHNLVIDESEFWLAIDDYSLEVIDDAQNNRILGIGISSNEKRITDLLFEKKKQLMKGLK